MSQLEQWTGDFDADLAALSKLPASANNDQLPMDEALLYELAKQRQK